MSYITGEPTLEQQFHLTTIMTSGSRRWSIDQTPLAGITGRLRKMSEPGLIRQRWQRAAAASTRRCKVGTLDNTPLQFRRWASTHHLSQHTCQMLALEQFDSMNTIKMLRPEMLTMLSLSQDEELALLTAINKSGWSNDEEQEVASYSSDDKVEKKYDRQMNSRRVSFNDAALVHYRGTGSSQDPHGVGRSHFGDIDHVSLQEEIAKVTERLVTECTITQSTKEDILSATSIDKQLGCLAIILQKSKHQVRSYLENLQNNNTGILLNSCKLEHFLANDCNNGETASCTESSDDSDDQGVSLISTISGKENPNFKEDIVLEVEEKLYKSMRKFGRKGCNVGEFQDATSVTVSEVSGNIYITDLVNNRIQVFDQTGHPFKLISETGITEPRDLVVCPGVCQDRLHRVLGESKPDSSSTDEVSDILAVTYKQCACVWIVSSSGEYIKPIGKDVLKHPSGICFDKQGRLIVSDIGHNSVIIFNMATGKVEMLHGCGGFKQPRYVAVSDSGGIIVSDSGNHCIKVFSEDGTFLHKFGELGRRSGQFRYPYGVCIFPGGQIAVADHYNNRVSLFDGNGKFLFHLVTDRNSCVLRPQGIAISGNGDLLITHGGMKAFEVLVFQVAEHPTATTRF